MTSRTLSSLALALTLALSPSAARAGDGESRGDRGKDQAQRETIRGVVAGVTVEGETMIDLASHRAQTAEMSFLTVVGSPAHHGGNYWSHKEMAHDKGKASPNSFVQLSLCPASPNPRSVTPRGSGRNARSFQFESFFGRASWLWTAN